MDSCIHTKLFNFNVTNASTTYARYKFMKSMCLCYIQNPTRFPKRTSLNTLSTIACNSTIATNNHIKLATTWRENSREPMSTSRAYGLYHLDTNMEKPNNNRHGSQ